MLEPSAVAGAGVGLRIGAAYQALPIALGVALSLTMIGSDIMAVLGLGPWPSLGNFISSPVYCTTSGLAFNEGMLRPLALAW